ncbi:MULTISPECIES: hypothetical protein [Actinomycetes]|uniref:hypothetical protein n=1 Tax=Actinomycetes TaxID=1760 RepID=UPI0006897E39|nr:MULTISPECIES: hypothetical protein [Actinomycetes]
MTRQTMIDAARRKEPRSRIYGIGICKSAGEFVDYEIGLDDYERDVQWAKAQLNRGGVGPGDHVLITTPNHELAVTSALVKALRQIGATYTPAETYGWDASRFTSVLETLPITVVIAVGGETLSAVAAQQPDLSKVFADVRLTWARPDAHAQLKAANVKSQAMALLGPALALADPDTPDQLVVNAAEWSVRELDGRLLVSSTDVRYAPVVDVVADVKGRIVGQSDSEIRIQL